MLRYCISNFRVPFDKEAGLQEALARRLGVKAGDLQDLKILKRSLDARQNHKNIFFQFSIEFSLSHSLSAKGLKAPNGTVEPVRPDHSSSRIFPRSDYRGPRPVVVGFGPAGLFAAHALCDSGIPPIVLEMGDPADQRQKRINQLWRDGVLDAESNVQFGEGGAGFFSDGKLYTRVRSPLVKTVYEAFVRFGAKESILYDNRPHLGTDKLKKILVNFREKLVRQGADIRFRSRVKELVLREGRVRGVLLANGTIIETDTVFLCAGHSARPLFRALNAQGVAMAKKDFAVGFRLEHPQALVNRSQYGKFCADPRLPPADYDLSLTDPKSGTSVFSFCMCPGGMVLLATSEEGRVVTNGMSFSTRRGELANAGIVAAVKANDTGAGLFSGVEFQEAAESKAFELGDRYRAPAQRVVDFLAKKKSAQLPDTTYLPGVESADLRTLYPEIILRQIERGLAAFSKKLLGLTGDQALLIAPETRTSSPLRLVREPKSFESLSTPGLYPLGEGAGYAGGITSSAVDGLAGVQAWISAQKLRGLLISHPS